MAGTLRMLRAIVGLLSLGSLGVSAALAAVPPKSEAPPSGEASVAGQGVADRLSAIRRIVSRVTAEHSGLALGDPNIEKAWWGNWHGGGWRNGGGGWGGWRNGGGGWRNGGWPNFWGNW
jgi:rSAM-associated Gly-rich repeat protein